MKQSVPKSIDEYIAAPPRAARQCTRQSTWERFVSYPHSTFRPAVFPRRYPSGPPLPPAIPSTLAACSSASSCSAWNDVWDLDEKSPSKVSRGQHHTVREEDVATHIGSGVWPASARIQACVFST